MTLLATERGAFAGLVAGGDVRVPVLGGGTRRYVALDNAATTPPFAETLAAVNRMVSWYGSVHRGSGFKSRLSTDAYEAARHDVARFVGADPARDAVVFGRNATDMLNHLAAVYPFPPGAVVLVSGMEHHSNDLPWRRAARVVHVAVGDNGRLDERDLRLKVQEHGRRIALFAVTGASNVTGIVNPVHRWARWVHEAGGRIVVDAAQLAPHRPIAMLPHDHPEHLDLIVFSAHKLYAPFGTGVLVAPARLFDGMEPYQAGGGTVETVDFDHVAWASLPEREEAGTPNVLGAVALAASIRTYDEIGWPAIRDHERELAARAFDALGAIPGVSLHPAAGDIDDTGEDRLGVVAFNVRGLPHALVSEILADEWGIATRSGCFCAHPYVKRLLGLSLAEEAEAQQRIRRGDRSDTPGMVRASIGLQSTIEDIQLLAAAVEEIAAGRHRPGYVLDRAAGSWTHPDLDGTVPHRLSA